MSSIRDIRASSAVPHDLARLLGPSGVHEILMVLWQGYHDLLNDSNICISASSLEDDVTLELCGKISSRWYNKNRASMLKFRDITPVHQYPDKTLKKGTGFSPTIDFCFRDWGTDNSYFGVECKNLYHHDNAKIKRYVETGVENYTTGRYGSQSSESSLVGYVLSGKIPEIVNELTTAIAKVNPIENLKRERQFGDPQYVSLHKRSMDGELITLHHLFFDFT